MIHPAYIKPGDTIGVMAPSSRIERPRIDKGVKLLREHGYEVFIHPQTYQADGCITGAPEDKAAALNELFENEDIDAIIFARGGNGAGGIKKHLDYSLIKSNPKIVMGYSDTTSLLNAIYRETDLITFHGPLIHNIANHIDNALKVLTGEKAGLDFHKGKTLFTGKAAGTVTGGNLSLFQTLIGTPWLPDLNGAILFFEDCSDELSRYDRMFGHLRDSGILESISGLVIGEFKDSRDSGKMPFGHTLENIVTNHTRDLNIPVIFDAPFGHGDNQEIFAIGMPATLTAHDTGYSLSYDAPLFESLGAGPDSGSVSYHKTAGSQ